jgi:hypothetical protein
VPREFQDAPEVLYRVHLLLRQHAVQKALVVGKLVLEGLGQHDLGAWRLLA